MVRDDPESSRPIYLLPPWSKTKFFKNAFAVLLTLAIIFLAYQVAFLLTPIVNFISILFAPIIISGLFYYLLRPLVIKLEKIHFPRHIAIILIYVIALICLILTMTYLVPLVITQVKSMADLSVGTWKSMSKNQNVFSNPFGININEEIQQYIIGFLQQVTSFLSKNLLDLLGWVTHLAAILAVIPFVVFYLLKDDKKIEGRFTRCFPEEFRDEVQKIVDHVDGTLSSYITGLVLVSASVGGLLFIGYLAIGLDYALVLSIFALIFTTIPFLGPFIAILPALLVGFSQGFLMMVKVTTVFVIVQQLESNFLSPQIIGQRLHIHPLTIILLLLAAGSLYGLAGLVLATPTYALSKVILSNLYKIYRLHASR